MGCFIINLNVLNVIKLEGLLTVPLWEKMKDNLSVVLVTGVVSLGTICSDKIVSSIKAEVFKVDHSKKRLLRIFQFLYFQLKMQLSLQQRILLQNLSFILLSIHTIYQLSRLERTNMYTRLSLNVTGEGWPLNYMKSCC